MIELAAVTTTEGTSFALCLCLTVFAVYRSRDGFKTLAYIMVSFAATVAAFFLLALIPALDTEVVGFAALDVSLLVGALAGLVHSHRTRSAPLSKGEEAQLQRWEESKRRKSRF